MSEKEKATVEKIATVMDNLPDNKKEWLVGFMEGAAAMMDKKKEEKDD